MSFAEFDEPSAWGEPEPAPADVVKDAIRKEQIIKDITAAQSDLQSLLDRVKNIRGDVDKLTSDNATLQMYIDNLTLQIARKR